MLEVAVWIGCVRGSPFFFFQAEDGIRDLVRSRGLGDVYKRQGIFYGMPVIRNPLRGKEEDRAIPFTRRIHHLRGFLEMSPEEPETCLLYTSDAADERSSVDLGGRRIIKKKKKVKLHCRTIAKRTNNSSPHDPHTATDTTETQNECC